MKDYKIITFGCRANQFESACMAQNLEAAGYRPAASDGPAGVVVINTCTVTHRADKQARQALRRAVRENPGARIIATGCLAKLEAEELAAIKGVAEVIEQRDQKNLVRILERTPPLEQAIDPGLFSDFGPAPLQGRSRALLKVQDGCDNACTYCRVRLARGRSRSLPLDRALTAAEELARAGFAELVLTGIHLGFYGKDLKAGTDLTGLVERLLAAPAGPRLRLSSIEPTEVSDRLLDIAAASPRFCRHFHLPLQSGDKRILRAMGRPYDPAQYSAVARRIRAAMPDAALGADVMVGFPGEDRAAFENTKALIKDLDLSYLHVFPFSPRPGTRAEKMSPRPASREVTQRAGQLRRLAEKIKKTYLDQQLGKTLPVVVEGRREAKTGLLTGVSGNYCTLIFPGPDRLFNQLKEVEVTARSGGRLEGRPV